MNCNIFHYVYNSTPEKKKSVWVIISHFIIDYKVYIDWVAIYEKKSNNNYSSNEYPLI